MHSKTGTGTLVGPFAEEKDHAIQKEGTVDESRRNQADTTKVTTAAESSECFTRFLAALRSPMIELILKE